MLLTKNLIENVEEIYVPMLKMVNIPDFTKCIAQFSGLEINDVSEESIKKYLIQWAKNKYRFFGMLGNKTRLDIPFEYEHLRDDIQNELKDISKQFPVYSYWLDEFRNVKTNKVTSVWDFNFSFRTKLDELFPQYRMAGSTITHFLKGCLNAPDELVTKVAAIFENQKIKANYTISIDPVDMMLASENPYDWTSCYRLELDRNDSHADGCLAAVLDETSLISYVWNNEGKFSLYKNYDFKSIRYKRMRQWLAISKKMTSIHFNAIYPGKSSYEESFEKQLRCMVEKVVSKHLGIEDKWSRCNDEPCDREFEYGYSEYDRDNVWKQKNAEPEEIAVFTEEIVCPCGCGNFLPGSHGDCEDEYNGCGFTCENYEERYWCDYADDWCESHGEDCGCCCYYKDANPICDIEEDDYYECPNPDNWYVDDGVMASCNQHCSNCPRWKEHHPDEEALAPAEKKEEENITTGDYVTIQVNNPSNELVVNDNYPDNVRYTLVSTNWQPSVQSIPIERTLDEAYKSILTYAVNHPLGNAATTTESAIRNFSATAVENLANDLKELNGGNA